MLQRFEHLLKQGMSWTNTLVITNIELAEYTASTGSTLSPTKERALIKNVSNQLSRCHHMGFLRRQRTDRICLSANGKRFCRGFMYRYGLTKQGLQYIRFRKSISSSPAEAWALDSKRFGILPLTDLPSTSKPEPMISAASPLTGRYHRFPPRIDPRTLSTLEYLNNEIAKRDVVIADLRNEIQLLESASIVANEKLSKSGKLLD